MNYKEFRKKCKSCKKEYVCWGFSLYTIHAAIDAISPEKCASYEENALGLVMLTREDFDHRVKVAMSRMEYNSKDFGDIGRYIKVEYAENYVKELRDSLLIEAGLL